MVSLAFGLRGCASVCLALFCTDAGVRPSDLTSVMAQPLCFVQMTQVYQSLLQQTPTKKAVEELKPFLEAIRVRGMLVCLQLGDEKRKGCPE